MRYFPAVHIRDKYLDPECRKPLKLQGIAHSRRNKNDPQRNGVCFC